MAIAGNLKRPRRLFPGLACTVPFLAGMVLIFVGERLVGSPLTARLALDGAGAAAIFWAILARMLNWMRTEGDRRAVEGRILLSYLAGGVSLLFYAAQLEPFAKKLQAALVAEKLSAERILVALRVLWPIVWLSAVIPLLFMETAYSSMVRAPQIELRRVAFSAASGLVVAWVLASLFLINYVATSHNRKWDLSFGRTSSPSEDARRLISSLNETFEVILFYPEVNEVLEELSGYFDPFRSASPNFEVRTCDEVLEPKLAKDLGVNQNGAVVFRYGAKKEVARVGLTLGEARSQLAKLDQTFQEKFLQLVSSKKVAYFTAGHGERSYEVSGSQDKDPRAPLKGLRSILKSQNFEMKVLGLGQGLASEVPPDASLIVIVDPTEDFLPEEVSALRRYLEQGGRMWVALDPDQSSSIAGLIQEYGVRFVGVPLANETQYMRAFYNKADRYNLYTNRPSSHPSVSTLSRNTSRLAVVLLKTGSLEKVEGGASGARVVMTLRSMPDTWADENRNMEPDTPGEEKKIYDLAAAVSLPVEAPQAGDAKPGNDSSAPSGTGEKNDKTEKGKKPEMRMIVLADADAVSDQVIANLGNYYFFDEGLQWLFEEEKLLGGVASGEDVRIMHTKEEDVLWFYGTIFAVPLAVLGAGITYNRLRLRRRRRNRAG